MPRPLISFVLPVYNEEAGILHFHAELTRMIATLDDRMDAEMIYVNDGSTDTSLEILATIARSDSRVRILDFAKNFGHQLAITAGLDDARGDAVITMDTDLQDPPAVVPELLAAWEGGADIVYARRRSRQDKAVKKATAHTYYRVLRWLSNIDIPRDTGDFRLLSRAAVDVLVQYRERNRYVRGMVADLGFTATFVDFDRNARFAGKTAYTWSKMFRLAADGVLGFSSKPLTLIAHAGMWLALLSLGLAIYALVVRILFSESAVPGWAFLAAGVFFFLGVQTTMIGIVGAYVGRIYTEVQARPLYTVRAIIGGAPREHAPATPQEDA